MKKAFIWKLLLGIGLCPFLAPFFYYFLQCFVHKHYSLTLIDMLILWSFLYWPTYVIGLILIIIAAIKLKK